MPVAPKRLKLRTCVFQEAVWSPYFFYLVIN